MVLVISLATSINAIQKDLPLFFLVFLSAINISYSRELIPRLKKIGKRLRYIDSVFTPDYEKNFYFICRLVFLAIAIYSVFSYKWYLLASYLFLFFIAKLFTIITSNRFLVYFFIFVYIVCFIWTIVYYI